MTCDRFHEVSELLLFYYFTVSDINSVWRQWRQVDILTTICNRFYELSLFYCFTVPDNNSLRQWREVEIHTTMCDCFYEFSEV